MLDFAQAIIRLTGSRSKIVHKPLPQDDPKMRQPDIMRARKWLHWEPKIGLSEGLKKTIGWFEARI
jgi:nucleoside-diphosphate-sugar epimerase